MTEQSSIGTGMRRGPDLKSPSCGTGQLLLTVPMVNAHCAVCGARSADAAFDASFVIVGQVWMPLSVELRSHATGGSGFAAPVHVELALALGTAAGPASRTGADQTQQTIPIARPIWMTPMAVGNTLIAVAVPRPKTSTTTLLTRSSADVDSPRRPVHAICCIETRQEDRTERSSVPRATDEAASGHTFVKSAPLPPATGLHRCRDSASSESGAPVSDRCGHLRLRRVLDYISANLADELTLADLAHIACLSTFHFARMFVQAVGISPRRYINCMRLDKAKAEIAGGRLPLAQIALNARFSSQASFTRAFRREAGMTPGEYRRCQRKHHELA